MVSVQVISEDNAVAFAGSQGNFELNAMRVCCSRQPGSI